MFYWFLKWIAIGPLLRLVFRPTVEGIENVPEDGPAILASNHLSYADWLFMPLTLPRQVPAGTVAAGTLPSAGYIASRGRPPSAAAGPGDGPADPP